MRPRIPALYSSILIVLALHGLAAGLIVLALSALDLGSVLLAASVIADREGAAMITLEALDHVVTVTVVTAALASIAWLALAHHTAIDIPGRAAGRRLVWLGLLAPVAGIALVSGYGLLDDSLVDPLGRGSTMAAAAAVAALLYWGASVVATPRKLWPAVPLLDLVRA
jgi:hypothetical protein